MTLHLVLTCPFTIHGYITNSQRVQFPVGRALHQYRRGHGFDSRSIPNFLIQALVSYATIIPVFISLSAFQTIYLIFHTFT